MTKYSFSTYRKECSLFPQLGALIGMWCGIWIVNIIAYPAWVVVEFISSMGEEDDNTFL